MAQTEAQKRAQRKYLSKPENKRKRVAYNTARNKKLKHKRNIEHAKNIIALGNDVQAVTDYLEHTLGYRRTKVD